MTIEKRNVVEPERTPGLKTAGANDDVIAATVSRFDRPAKGLTSGPRYKKLRK